MRLNHKSCNGKFELYFIFGSCVIIILCKLYYNMLVFVKQHKLYSVEPGVKNVLKLKTNVNNEIENMFTGNMFP